MSRSKKKLNEDNRFNLEEDKYISNDSIKEDAQEVDLEMTVAQEEEEPTELSEDDIMSVEIVEEKKEKVVEKSSDNSRKIKWLYPDNYSINYTNLTENYIYRKVLIKDTEYEIPESLYNRFVKGDFGRVSFEEIK